MKVKIIIDFIVDGLICLHSLIYNLIFSIIITYHSGLFGFKWLLTKISVAILIRFQIERVTETKNLRNECSQTGKEFF